MCIFWELGVGGNETEKVLEKTIAKNFPTLVKDTILQIE